ncbi:MAG: glycosyltransferase family 2 protein [Vicinamibacteraceae bacterium]
MTGPVTSVAMVIVSFNTREDLAGCLSSLAADPPATPHEIVVVDNASTDGSADLVSATWPETLIIRNQTNVGFARATNQGIRATTSDLVLLLNSDTVVPSGSVDGLCAALLADPQAAAVGPRLVDGNGLAELSFGRMVGPWNELRQKALGWLSVEGPTWARNRLQAWTRVPRDADWVSGACLLVRRRSAEDAGLLDERFFMYGEDVDFCATLRANGGRILFVPAVQVVHLRGRSSRAAPAATTAAYRRSQIAFYEKHHPAWAPVLRGFLRLRGKHPDDQRSGFRGQGSAGDRR